MTPATIRLDGTALSCADVAAVARSSARVAVTDAGRQRARAAAQTVREVARRRPVYGRTTGVGANRTAQVAPGDPGHGLNLLRSHASGAGPVLDDHVARALLVVRLNQLAAGGSGVDAAVLDALEEALRRGLTPPIHTYGSIGTADVAALASTALCLLGERPWRGGTMPPHRLDPDDALAFMSSNAATVATAALFCTDLRGRLEASLVVAALSCLAVDASREPFAEAVHHACPHPGQRRAADRVRELLAADAPTSRRIQDPFSYRALPQVLGAALNATAQLEEVLRTEMNAAAENPLVVPAAGQVLHNGNFLSAEVALSLDTARVALFQAAALSTSRLGTLMEPEITGLAPFLASGAPTDSGLMVLEYVAHSALADLRQRAAPAGLGVAVLSRGVEEHASFSTQAARSGAQAIAAYDAVLSSEAVAAVRALHHRDLVPRGRALRDAHDLLRGVLDPRTSDRPLDHDLEAAAVVLPRLAGI